MLDINTDEKLISDSAQTINSTIIHPSYIGNNVVIENSVIGPYASIGEGSVIKNSVIKNSIIQSKANVNGAILNNTMLGNSSVYKSKFKELSIGDFNVIED
jgi:glucose-1-phosphate thymidylyltransferase